MAVVRVREFRQKLDSFLGLDPDVTIPCLSSVPKGTKVGTFDVGGSIKQIQAGKMLFAIDQQQYLQGYLPVVFAVLYVTFKRTDWTAGEGARLASANVVLVRRIRSRGPAAPKPRPVA